MDFNHTLTITRWCSHPPIITILCIITWRDSSTSPPNTTITPKLPTNSISIICLTTTNTSARMSHYGFTMCPRTGTRFRDTIRCRHSKPTSMDMVSTFTMETMPITNTRSCLRMHRCSLLMPWMLCMPLRSVSSSVCVLPSDALYTEKFAGRAAVLILSSSSNSRLMQQSLLLINPQQWSSLPNKKLLSPCLQKIMIHIHRHHKRKLLQSTCQPLIIPTHHQIEITKNENN